MKMILFQHKKRHCFKACLTKLLIEATNATIAWLNYGTSLDHSINPSFPFTHIPIPGPLLSAIFVRETRLDSTPVEGSLQVRWGCERQITQLELISVSQYLTNGNAMLHFHRHTIRCTVAR